MGFESGSVRTCRTGAGGVVGRLLLDEGLEAVGEVARQGLEQAGGLDQRRLEGTGDAGQQFLAGRQVGEGLDVVGGQRLVPSTPPFNEQRVASWPNRAAPWRAGDVAGDERQGGRADEELARGRRPRPRGRRAGPGCSCTPCARRRLAAMRCARPASCLTVRPRYSVTNTAWAVPSFSVISADRVDLPGRASRPEFIVFVAVSLIRAHLLSLNLALVDRGSHEVRAPRGTASRSAMERAPRLVGRTHYPSASGPAVFGERPLICKAGNVWRWQRSGCLSRRRGFEAVGVDVDAGAHRRRDA